MDINWAFSATDAIIDGLVLGIILQYFAQRQSKKDQRELEQQQKENAEKLEQQEKEDSEMLDAKLDKLYDRLVDFEKKHDDDVE